MCSSTSDWPSGRKSALGGPGAEEHIESSSILHYSVVTTQYTPASTTSGSRSMAGVTYALLSKLTGTLVLGVPQQFDDAALIGSKTDDLTGDVTDERSAAGRLALGAANLVLRGVEGSGFLYWNMLATSRSYAFANCRCSRILCSDARSSLLPVRSQSRGLGDGRMLCPCPPNIASLPPPASLRIFQLLPVFSVRESAMCRP